MIRQNRFILFIFLLFLYSPDFPLKATANDDIVYLRFWGFGNTQSEQGRMAQVREFNRRNPKIQVIIGTPGGRGGMDPQKLMTAIVGNSPPDIVLQDRFAVGGWASRDAFLPLDSGYCGGFRKSHDRLKTDLPSCTGTYCPQASMALPIARPNTAAPLVACRSGTGR